MKTGLFGGTFNPVHSGHVMIAADIMTSFALDRIIVVPAADPPHKTSEFMAPISLRLEMARLAFADSPRCIVSDAESKRRGRSYTIDTVDYFLKTLPLETELFFIAGLDAFLELDTWKQYLSLIEKIPFIVINREVTGQSGQNALESFIRLKISDAYTFYPEKSCYIHPSLQPIFFHTRPVVTISSTEIRRRLKNSRPVHTMLPVAVEHFIKKRSLYQ